MIDGPITLAAAGFIISGEHGDPFQQRRLAGAVFTDDDGDGTIETQLKIILQERQTESAIANVRQRDRSRYQHPRAQTAITRAMGFAKGLQPIRTTNTASRCSPGEVRPTGKSLICCPAPSQKYFASPVGQIISTSSHHPVPRRGAYHDRHERWDGMLWTRQRFARDGIAGRVERLVSDQQLADERCCSVRRSRVVLTPRRWRQVCGVKSARPGLDKTYPLATVAKEPGHRGARRKLLKPLRAGMPGDSGVLVVTRVRSTNTKCTRDRGCSGHPAFPTPSFGARDKCKPRAHRAART